MSNVLSAAFLILAGLGVVAAQGPEPPLADTRLTVHTLVREDIFAGFLRDDTTRLARAERSLETLLASRPAERPSVLAWQGAAAFTRAVLAQDANRVDDFRTHLGRSQEHFAAAMRLGPDAVPVFAIVGGISVILTDRLPEAERARSWERAHAAYQRLWELQSAIIDKLPLHHKGELLAGLAESAQRSGRVDEVDGHLDQILASMADTAYAARARQWKDDPAARGQNRLVCQTCHAPGMLTARMAEVAKP